MCWLGQLFSVTLDSMQINAKSQPAEPFRNGWFLTISTMSNLLLSLLLKWQIQKTKGQCTALLNNNQFLKQKSKIWHVASDKQFWRGNFLELEVCDEKWRWLKSLLQCGIWVRVTKIKMNSFAKSHKVAHITWDVSHAKIQILLLFQSFEMKSFSFLWACKTFC